MSIVKVSNFVKMVNDYLLSNDERMMFDWLIVKQEDFGIGKPFRHSIPQVQKETKITRHTQEKIIKRFVKIGFLKVGIEYFQKNPYRTYFVDFTILSKPEVLSQIINPETDTYSYILDGIEILAKEQVKKEKPLSKYKVKQMAKEKSIAEEGAENLYTTLCNTWKNRIEMYNNGELTGEKPDSIKIYSKLPLGKNGKNMLIKLRTIYDDSTIRNGFAVYSDKCLKKEIIPRNIFLYFLDYKDGRFDVVDDMINFHSLNYGKRVY